MNKKTIWFLLVLFLIISFMLTSCVGSAEPKDNNSNKTTQNPPDWFTRPPEEDAKYKYYIGSGTNDEGDISAAEDNAIRDLMDSIIMYIGVEVTAETTATAKASLDTFQSDLVQTVKTKGSARVSGFEIQERLPLQKGDKVTIYLLARYEKKELEKERERIRKIFEEQAEAISGPEKEGDSYFSDDDYYNAVIKYIEAAAAASTSKITNAEIKFKRNIDKAKKAVDKINLIKLNDKLSGVAGQPFPEPFKVKVVSGSTDKDKGIANILIKVGYKEMTKKGKLEPRSQKIKTNKDGIIAFEHPIPDFVGSDNVSMYLDFESYLEPLWDVPAQYDEMVDGLDQLVNGKKVVFEYSVVSNAKNINTGIVVLDLDVEAKPVTKSETASSLLSALTTEGFKVKLLSMKPAELQDMGDFDAIELLSSKYKGDNKNAIFGTARILEFSEKDGKTLAKCSATIQVVNLETKEILLTVVKTVNSMGSDKQSAQSSGFKRLGSEIGKEIMNKLR